MIWTPSPRPPWSEWLMNLTLRDATAFMAHLYPIALPLALVIASAAMTGRARPLVSDASEFTRLRVGSPPERTVRSSVRRTELWLRHRSPGAFGGTDRQPRRESGVGREKPRGFAAVCA